jgi:hypothetical protein
MERKTQKIGIVKIVVAAVIMPTILKRIYLIIARKND